MKDTAKKQRRLILLCWMVYTAAYLGRYSYNANINLVISSFSVGKADAGLVATLFFLAYGAGQIVNGVFCKFYPKKYIIGGSLVISGAINIVVFAGVNFTAMKYLWLLNGMVQSVLWSSLVLILGRNLKAERVKAAVLAMSTTTACGTFVSYGVSSLLALTGNYRYSFLAGAVGLLIIAVIWFCSYNRLTAEECPRSEREEQPEQSGCSGRVTVFTVGLLMVFAVINNFIKDGLTTWVPSILKEMFSFSDSLSILLTLVLPVISICGTAVAVSLNKKVKDFIMLAALLFALSAVCVLGVELLSKTSFWPGMVVCFGAVSLLMSGINNVIVSMAPLYLRGKTNPGLISGLLNGFCYIGSTLSSYGLGAVADFSGWSGVFDLFLILSVLPVLAGAIHFAITRLKGKKAPKGEKNATNEGKSTNK